MSRKIARETAFKTIFEIPFHENNLPIDIICDEKNFEKLTAENDINYFKTVTTKCFDNIDIIDNIISESLKGWSMNRISKINLAILRLAICEIKYIDDIAHAVSINEAVELSKKYSDDDSPAFINGILASVIQQ